MTHSGAKNIQVQKSTCFDAEPFDPLCDPLTAPWDTIHSVTLPDPRNVTCGNRPYYEITSDAIRRNIAMNEYNTFTYVRLSFDSWYSQYAALEYLEFETVEFVAPLDAGY